MIKKRYILYSVVLLVLLFVFPTGKALSSGLLSALGVIETVSTPAKKCCKQTNEPKKASSCADGMQTEKQEKKCSNKTSCSFCPLTAQYVSTEAIASFSCATSGSFSKLKFLHFNEPMPQQIFILSWLPPKIGLSSLL